MDKRRYLSRHPRNPRTPVGMEADITGNPALDGFTTRERKPLKRDPYGSYGKSDACVAESLMDEHEARFNSLYGED